MCNEVAEHDPEFILKVFLYLLAFCGYLPTRQLLAYDWLLCRELLKHVFMVLGGNLQSKRFEHPRSVKLSPGIRCE